MEENKTEGNGEVRGVRMNSLVCGMKIGLMEKDLNDRKEPTMEDWGGGRFEAGISTRVPTYLQDH